MKMDDIIQEASGSSKWQIEVGHKFTITALFYLQVFIVAEMAIYVFLFYDVYHHNEELKNGNSLGLSTDILNQRKQRNVITLVGQFLAFIIEIIGVNLILLVVVYHGTNDFVGIVPRLKIFGSALLMITYFLTSPELRNFYFTN